MDQGFLNRAFYTRYCLALAAAALALLVGGAHLPRIGPWTQEHAVLFLCGVAAACGALAVLPLLLLLAVLGWLVRTGRRATRDLAAGDAVTARERLRRLERWTPRLRWLMLHPARVEEMQTLVCGTRLPLSPSPAVPAPRGLGGTGNDCGETGGAFVVYRRDDHGNRFEVRRYGTREEAERCREELERIAAGHKVFYGVEGPDGRAT